MLECDKCEGEKLEQGKVDRFFFSQEEGAAVESRATRMSLIEMIFEPTPERGDGGSPAAARGRAS